MAGSELVQSLLRGLDILQVAGRSAEGISLRDLSNELGLRPTTVHNLARTLVAKDFLVKQGKPPRYRLGPAVTHLANELWDTAFHQRSTNALLNLAEVSPAATVILAEAVGYEVMCRLRISPERGGVLERPRNQVMHPYGTAAGLVFQAFWPQDVRQAYQRRYPLCEYGTHLWPSDTQLEQILMDIRRQGFAAPRFEHKGVCAVAAPVIGAGQEIIACVGASVPSDRLASGLREQIIASVCRTAQALSELN